MTVLRVAAWIVVANLVVLTAQAARVVFTYAAVYSLTRKPAARPLPLHVTLIAGSYLVYTAGNAFLLVAIPEPYLVFRTVLWGVNGVIGQFALWQVLKYERRRYSVATGYTDPDEVL